MDWFPWYFIKYRQDTMHLDPYQDGCYRRLIDHYMTTRAPLPDNDHALARIVGDSPPNWVANGGAIVRAFFQARNGVLFHKKCEEILKDQDKRQKSFVESGKKGAAKRWNKNKDLDSHPNRDPIATPIGFDSTIQDNTGVYTVLADSNLLTPKPNSKINKLPSVTAARGGVGGLKKVLGNGGLGFKIETYLGDDDLIDAKAAAPGWDIYHLMRVYDEGINSGLRPAPSKPSAAFIGWLPKYTKGKRP